MITTLGGGASAANSCAWRRKSPNSAVIVGFILDSGLGVLNTQHSVLSVRCDFADRADVFAGDVSARVAEIFAGGFDECLEPPDYIGVVFEHALLLAGIALQIVQRARDGRVGVLELDVVGKLFAQQRGDLQLPLSAAHG